MPVDAHARFRSAGAIRPDAEDVRDVARRLLVDSQVAVQFAANNVTVDEAITLLAAQYGRLSTEMLLCLRSELSRLHDAN